MSLAYRLLYALRITPWDRDEATPELVATSGELTPDRALDLGCGTGAQAVHLAREGWNVTAIDVVTRALRAARARAAAAGVDIDFRRADVSRLQHLGVDGFAFAYDRGCFHGLPEHVRDAYAQGLTAVTAPGATFLLMAFQPPTPAGLPAGATREEIDRRLGDSWRTVSEGPPQEEVPKRLERARPTWYRYQRT
jgi:SAM-dependent methyltransferase